MGFCITDGCALSVGMGTSISNTSGRFRTTSPLSIILSHTCLGIPVRFINPSRVRFDPQGPLALIILLAFLSPMPGIHFSFFFEAILTSTFMGILIVLYLTNRGLGINRQFQLTGLFGCLCALVGNTTVSG